MIYTLDYIRGLTAQYKDIKINNLSEFLDHYNAILARDSDTPIFSQTKKYKSFPKKYFKKRGNKVIISGRSGFKLFEPNSDVERIQQVVRRTLNKINDSNGNRIINELKREIQRFNSIETLEILAKEVHGKIIYDIQYQDNYIDMCAQLWSMTQWHDQLVTIIDDNGKLYWGCNYNIKKESTTLHGPFDNEQQLRENSRKIVNFRYTLLSLLQKEFNKRDEYLSSDGDAYKAKRHIIAIVEFITKLHKKGYLSETVVHVMFFGLLGITKLDVKTNVPVMPTEKPHGLLIEAFITGWKLMFGGQIKRRCMDQYLDYLGKIKDGFTWDNRMRFMMEDILLSKREIKSWARVAQPKPVLKYTDIEDMVIKYRKSGKVNPALQGVNKIDLTEIVLNSALDNPGHAEMLAALVRNVPKNIKKTVFQRFMNNIDDIKIDIPKAPELMQNYEHLFNVM